ncbi:binding-protein-dependent transport systems inner membrane component [Thermobaculum terrenum ATCC BAA-798]|uniref:Binding-protein-dependent transport systems inner membrane component n=1 Tax=Thermobaculum terrenum (strain ATCC BAA-798 / CCMEE 7001 / YNP1) TaxID=525904 RepID=D1CB53_THET1|nr:carbohydrate ABC transporter permease [Thermobaculum terrenum]ACZ42018.1 binding-protein-dependent transport systems inner membrane component [Thermobaculum terrenum ATCC BAA-798]
MALYRSMGRSEKLWDAGVYLLLTLSAIVVIVPIWYVLMISITPFEVWARTGGTLLPHPSEITFEAYKQLLSSWRLPRAFQVSVFITVFGTLLNLIFTTMMAYPLSKKNFRLRNPILLFILFTLLFNGGLVPTYIVVRNLGLIDSYLALILPGLISGFNVLIMKAFFQNIPDELEEAAKIDGASDFQVLWHIILPLSKPILATIGLFYAVGHWNSFFDAILYIRSADKQPLQVVLREILAAGNLTNYVPVEHETMPTESLRMAAVVISTIPVLIVYPFLQRHFTAGVLLGSIKE